MEKVRAVALLPEKVALGSVEADSLNYDSKPYVRRVKKRIAEPEKLLKLIDMAREEPVIKGSDISAYRIAALHDCR